MLLCLLVDQDANQGKYAFNCYFRTDGQWNLVPQSGHISGHLVPGDNIYVADLSGQLPAGFEVLARTPCTTSTRVSRTLTVFWCGVGDR